MKVMITLDQIEEKVSDHFVTYGMNKPPRFILLDKKSYKNLCKSLKPKERVQDPNIKSVKVSKINAGGAELEVLEVNTSQKLFEVVG